MYKISFYEKPFEEKIFESLNDAFYYCGELLTDALMDKIITIEEFLECMKEVSDHWQIPNFLIIQEIKE